MDGTGTADHTGGVDASTSVALGINSWSLGDETIGNGRYRRSPCGGGDRYAAVGYAVMRILELSGVPEYPHPPSNQVNSYHPKNPRMVQIPYV